MTVDGLVADREIARLLEGTGDLLGTHVEGGSHRDPLLSQVDALAIDEHEQALGDDAEPALAADRLTARLRFFPLFVGRIEIADIALVGAIVGGAVYLLYRLVWKRRGYCPGGDPPGPPPGIPPGRIFPGDETSPGDRDSHSQK